MEKAVNLGRYKTKKNLNLLIENLISKGSFSSETPTGIASAFAFQVRTSHLSSVLFGTVYPVLTHLLPICGCRALAPNKLKGAKMKFYILHRLSKRLDYGIANGTLNPPGRQHWRGLRAVFNGNGYNYKAKLV